MERGSLEYFWVTISNTFKATIYFFLIVECKNLLDWLYWVSCFDEISFIQFFNELVSTLYIPTASTLKAPW